MNFLMNGIPADPVEQAKIEQAIESYSQDDQIYFYHYRMTNAKAYSDTYYYWRNKLIESSKSK